MNDLAAGFDYDTLAPDLREMVQEHTGEIRTLARRAAQDIVEIGERLIEVKGALEHGRFQEWVKAEFGWSYQAAHRFMQVGSQFKTLNLRDLNIAPSALYALASGSTPGFIREEIIEMAQATGHPVTHKAVQERLAAHHADTPPAEPEDESVPTPAPEVEPPALLSAPPRSPALAAPPPQEAGTPAADVDNDEMARKRKEGKGGSLDNYKPLQYDFEEVENARGELLKVPVLPDLPREREIKQKDFEKAASRFENTAASTLTAMGKLVAYTPELLQEVVDSPEARQKGAATRVDQLIQRAEEVLGLLRALRTAEAAQPMQELLPSAKKDADRVLEMN